MMRKNIFFMMIWITAVMLAGCEKTDIGIEEAMLMRSWTHSYEEENSNEEKIFRPSDYKEFLPGWYREVFIFADKGNCEYLMVYPNDGHSMVHGKWKFRNRIISIYQEDATLLTRFEVIELSDEILKVRRLGSK